VGRLAAGERWDLVFNIAEGLGGLARESQVPGLLDAYQIPYVFSEALTLAVTLHKGVAKHMVRARDVRTPDFEVVEDEGDIQRVRLSYPVFVKPVAEGSSRGISAASKVGSFEELDYVCRQLLGKYRQPVLVETFLPGREFTVGILGTGAHAKAIAVMEVTLGASAEPDAYSYSNKIDYENRIKYRVADDATARAAEAAAVRAWCCLGCRDAGRVDLRCDRHGNVHFLEVNPLPGLHPVRSDLAILCSLVGISYQQLIERIVASAVKRIIA
jgi:D-alanine-D-alanine ligase